MGVESRNFSNAHVTLEAPDWALKGGFPEDMPFTERAGLPEGATCVEAYIGAQKPEDDSQIFESGDLFFKVKLEEGK